MDRTSLIFCAGSLLASLAVAWLAYPLAALDPDVVARAATPQPAETLGLIDVGGGFGEVSALELVGYYVENPPAPDAAAAAAPVIRFGGC
jgi:hypothetical protein